MLLLLKSAVFPGSSPALLSVCFLSPESLQLFKTCRQQTMRHNHTVKTIWKEGAAQESKVKLKKKKKSTHKTKPRQSLAPEPSGFWVSCMHQGCHLGTRLAAQKHGLLSHLHCLQWALHLPRARHESKPCPVHALRTATKTQKSSQ